VDLTDNKASSTKVDFSPHYKPFGDDLEFIGKVNMVFGNAVYQGVNRYYLNNFCTQQHKTSKGDNFCESLYYYWRWGDSWYDFLPLLM
jgi:negative regulator of genetic competence, sporulation and motility